MRNVFLFHDAETGGLNGRLVNGKLGMDYYPIFELSFILTDYNLNQIGSPLRIVIHQSEKEIQKSSEWAIKQHTKSGLLDEVRASKISLIEAESMILEYLKSFHVHPYNEVTKHGPILAGNPILFDRTFMLCQMPKLNAFLHYRQLDVSVFAIAANAWYPSIKEIALENKTYQHLALPDIQDSIEELKIYKDILFSFPSPDLSPFIHSAS